MVTQSRLVGLAHMISPWLYEFLSNGAAKS
ncbi:uncharacterized protein FRV6_07796 [Fusarium oxysporum]|uniref:Uncharacterized protein n=1 Tax=Fusarium oxysporum TaxID=5507 RepID=A0A2H3TP78_FUSOX|nr:uncharacterized protein FRV6_07796 [Fusarium oxysporum]